jgi:hypothetical protein
LVISALGNRLRRPYILLSPTNLHVDALSQELLANAQAEFFALSNTVRITHNATLLSVETPGVLFARFAPKEPIPDNTLSQLLEVVQALDVPQACRKAPLLAVLRLYCIRMCEPKEIARKLNCSPALIYSRLDELSRRFNRPIRQLRRYSSHFEALEASLADPRARNINIRQSLQNSGQNETLEF